MSSRQSLLIVSLLALCIAAAPATQPSAATDAQKNSAKQKARERAGKDRGKYTPEQLKEAEELYQVANKNWRSAEAQACLEKMVAKYPDLNRTGCALLYLGQYAKGEDRVKLLKDAIEKHSDCFYFNGCQVGGYGRYVLLLTYLDLGKKDEAQKLVDELNKDYAEAIDHKGNLIVSMVPEIK